MLSPSTVQIVNATVPLLREKGVAITDYFYQNLLSEHPELTSLFNMTHQATGDQKQALASAVYAYAANHHKPEILAPVLNRIAHKHASLGIKSSQYTLVGKHLMCAIKQVLGGAVTAKVASAWDEVYWQLACDLVARESRLYEYQQTHPEMDFWQWMIIDDIVLESDGIKSFYLIPTPGKALPTFQPGQYISVKLQQGETPQEEKQQIRQYSLSNVPGQPYLRITVKKESAAIDSVKDGWLSSRLHTMVVGDQIQIGQPFGDFTDPDHHAPLVLISTGVGITPMISLWLARAKALSNIPVCFIHGSKRAEDIPLLPDLMAAAAALEHGQMHLFAESASLPGLDTIPGRVDVSALSLPIDHGTQYMLCGGMDFMRSQRQALLASGVDAANIRYEVFGPDLFAGLD